VDADVLHADPLNLDNKPLYATTFMSFVYAYGHFIIENLTPPPQRTWARTPSLLVSALLHVRRRRLFVAPIYTCMVHEDMLNLIMIPILRLQ
jgi:hypothetical protein